jgi:glucose-1-phosphate adenylyltransferase
MNDVLAMILAGGQGDRLSVLSEQRAKPAVVFAGHYRIIDFALSNCANSQLTKVCVLTQYRPRSLINHIGSGRAWGLDRPDGAVQILQPYLGRADMDWYQGTADAVYQNLYVIEESRVREVLILAGDHIYLTSYRNMIAYHRSQAADVTVGVYTVPLEEARRFGVLELDSNGRIVDWQEKPEEPKSTWVSMGVYCFNKDVLVEELQADADLGDQSTHDFGRDIIPRIFQRYRVFGYQYQEYWRDVGTIQSYWQAHMDLLGPRPALDLDDPDLKLRTSAPTMPPAWIGPRAEVIDSLISPGARIAGRVVRSVISPGAVIEEGAEVRDSIIQHRCVIRQGAVVDRSILDKEVTVGAGAYIGYGDDFRPNLERPDIVNTGITVIGKRATIPAGLRVGRNVVVGPGVEEELADLDELPSGASVHPTHIPLHLFV